MSLAARHLEANGLPTVIMGCAKDIVEYDLDTRKVTRVQVNDVHDAYFTPDGSEIWSSSSGFIGKPSDRQERCGKSHDHARESCHDVRSAESRMNGGERLRRTL